MPKLKKRKGVLGRKTVAAKREFRNHRSQNQRRETNPYESKEEELFEKEMTSLRWNLCEICKKSTLSSKKKNCGRRCHHFTPENDMDPGPVPPELEGLSYVEQQLIARVHPVLSVYRIKGQQIGYNGHVINFPQDVKEFAANLPHRINSLTSIIAVRVAGKNPSDYHDFHVRAAKVRNALLWLKSNNRYYSDINISEENLSLLPEDDNVFVQLNQTEDFISSCEDDSSCQIETTGVPMCKLPHQDDQVKGVLHWPTISHQPIDEFKTPGYITQAFPTLFPTGNADLGNPRPNKITANDYFKHLLQYHDKRFSDDPRFRSASLLDINFLRLKTREGFSIFMMDDHVHALLNIASPCRFFALNSTMRWAALTNGRLFVRHNEELRGKTVEQLKQMVTNSPSLIKKIMSYGTKLRGTKAYWRARLGELLDMECQLGLPTVFMTLSAADLHWPDLMRLMESENLQEDMPELNDKDRNQLLSNTPIVPCQFFFERTEFFLDKVLKKTFGVIDHWRRYEWQHRGSPHIHMLLWLPNAPKTSQIESMSEEEKQNLIRYFDHLISTTNPGPNIAPAAVHPCRKRLSEVENRQQDLAELVNKVQRHTKCSESYCLRKNKKTGQLECRYKFPFEMCDESHLIVNEKGQFEFVSKRNDPLINKYNPWVLQLWRANTDITPIMSKDAFLNYIAKYASKSEVKSKTMTEVFDNTLKNLDDQDDAKKAIQKVLIQTCAERDYSSQEVLHLALGNKLFSSSRAFVKINFNCTEWVAVGPEPDLGNNEDIQDGEEDLNDEARSSSSLNILDKYKLRPRNLENICLWDAASLYTPKRRGPWARRRTPAVVSVFPKRRLSSDPARNEEYYRQQVLLRIPWRNQNDARGDFDTWQEAFQRQQENHVPSSSGIPPPPEDEYEEVVIGGDDVPLEEWMVVAGKGPNDPVKLVEPGRREIDLGYDWGASSSLYGEPALLRGFINQQKAEQSIPPVEAIAPAVTLTVPQKKVMQILENQLEAVESKLEPNIQLLIVQGKAGCGKSTLIKTMTSKINEILGSDSYLLVAPTGSAALNINGNTIHSVFHIPIRASQFKPLEGAASRNFQQLMSNVKFIIVDEYSMIGLSLLGMMEQRCAEANPDSTQVFGGINVYIIGDLCQLPPVLSKPMYSVTPETDTERRGRYAFSQFLDAVILTESMRQTDTALRNALDELARGSCSETNYNLFASRFLKCLKEEEVTKFKEAVHIYSLRVSARKFNGEQLLGLHCPIARIPAKHNNATAIKGTADNACGLEPVIYLAKGARVVLRANLWVQAGLVNGSIGKVIDIVYNVGQKSPEDLPAAVMVRFDHYTGPNLEENLIPIPPILKTWSTGRTNCSREQIPLCLAWGSTVHQSQGQTYEKVVVDIGTQEFQCGLSYVALSRSKTLEGMVIHPEFVQKRLDNLKLMPSLKKKLHAVKKIVAMAKRTSGNVITPLPKTKPVPPPTQHPSPPQPKDNTTSICKEIVVVKEGAVEVAVMPGDGHCLFSSILHQLGLSKPDQPAHFDAVRLLRNQVVQYIKMKLQQPDNDLWVQQLQDSITAQPLIYQEETPINQKVDLFLHRLERGNEWGGSETLAAVAALKNVTITTFFEIGDGCCSVQYTSPENGDSDKTIQIVFRQRNHYDSVIRLL